MPRPQPDSLRVKSVIPIDEALRRHDPALYGITDPQTGRVVYVGRTNRLSNRMRQYMNVSQCHNGGLKQWLAERDCDFVVSLYDFGDDLFAAERKLIEDMKSQLFNLVGGGVLAWHKHDSKPWMCGSGIRCPSDMAIWHLKTHDRTGNHEQKIAAAKAARKKMTTKERCFYELGVAMDLSPMFDAAIKKWCERVAHKMIPVLEGSSSQNS